MAEGTLVDAAHFKNNKHDPCECIPVFTDFVYNQGRAIKKPENNVVFKTFICNNSARRWIVCGVCRKAFRMPGEKNAIRTITRHAFDVHAASEQKKKAPKRKRQKTIRVGSDTWRAINSLADDGDINIEELTAKADELREIEAEVRKKGDAMRANLAPALSAIEQRANV